MRIIAGPCQHESLEQSLEIAKECSRVCKKHKVDYVFKASFDKANRSNIDAKRGQGLVKTITDFESIKNSIPSLKIITDVHNVNEVLKMTVKIISKKQTSNDAEKSISFFCFRTIASSISCPSSKPYFSS